jgi:hypothetical protein
VAAPAPGGATPKWPNRAEGRDDRCDIGSADLARGVRLTSRSPTPMRQPKVAPPRQPDPFALSPEQRRRGARVVASAADDAADCAALLAILGLNPADGLTAPDGESPVPN